MDMKTLERFNNEFEYYMDVKLYVKLWIILHNYKIFDCKKNSYSTFQVLKKKIKSKKHFKYYQSLLDQLEKDLLKETGYTSPKEMKNELNVLLDNPSRFSVSELKEEIQTYQHSDNKKLTRLIATFKNYGTVSEYIGIANLVHIILSAIPTPRTVGINYDCWNEITIKKYIERYFNTDISAKTTFFQLDKIKSELHNFELMKKYNSQINLLNFYTSQKQKFTFYYLYFKELSFSVNPSSKRKDRQYNKYFIMFMIDFDSLTKNNKYLSASFNGAIHIQNLEYYFSKAYEYTKKDRDDNNISIPVFIFHKNDINNYMDYYYDNINTIPHYRLIAFENLTEMKKITETSSISKNAVLDSLQLIIDTLPIITAAESEIEKETENFSDYSQKKNYIQKISSIWNIHLESSQD